MKNFCYVLGVAIVSMLMGCGGQKALVQTQGDVEVVVPCSGPEYPRMRARPTMGAIIVRFAESIPSPRKQDASGLRQWVLAMI